jgi:hypothetical protein
VVELKEGLPWERLYAYDLVFVATSKMKLQEIYKSGRSVWNPKVLR